MGEDSAPQPQPREPRTAVPKVNDRAKGVNQPLKRVALHGSISVSIQLQNGRKLPARLHQLSITGGLLEVHSYLERIRITVTIPFASGTVISPKAEMLFPMRGGISFLLPFRIIRMTSDELQLLDREIIAHLKTP